MKSPEGPGRADYAALAAAAGAGLAYEILLLRVFSYSQWHHFASLAVSLALLGFGVAGTVLVLLGDRAVRLGDRLFLAGLLIGGVGMVTGFGLTQLITVRPLFAVWDSGELIKMLLVDFVAFVPFFGLALCIGQVFMRWPEATKALYGANLLGSGLGALTATALLAFLHLETALLAIPLFVLVAASAYGLARKGIRLAGTGSLAAAIAIALWIAAGPPSLPLSDFKKLAYLLDLPGSDVIERRPGLQADITVVRAASIRSAPGLSLRWGQAVPSHDAIVLGSDSVLPFPNKDSLQSPPAHFEALLGSLPFSLRPEGPVIVAGNSNWLPAPFDRADPARITWIQNNRQVHDLFRERGLPRGMRAEIDDPRGRIASLHEAPAIIYYLAAFAEADAASEDYLLTVESLETGLSKLQPNGLLAIPIRLHYPPRQAPRLLNMVAQALRESGSTNPLAQVAFLRSMQEGLVLVAPAPFRESDLLTIRAFAARWGFDRAALPGLRIGEANRFHQLAGPIHFQTAQALLAGVGAVPTEAVWYELDAPTDAQPYFWKSMRWETVPRLLGEFGRRGLIWLDWALLATVTKLAVAGLLAAILILLPLGRLPRSRKPLTRPRVCGYFAALGLGFLLLEMAAFQRALLYLDAPVITASLVFTVFLVGAGLGSLATPGRMDPTAPPGIFGAILGSALLAFVLLAVAESTLAGTPLALRLTGVAVAIAPLAWALGQAFPWGLRQLDEDRPLIPWAWGINGFFSVLAAPLATLLSVHFGQPVTWLAAAACYLLAWLIARSWARQWNWYA